MIAETAEDENNNGVTLQKSNKKLRQSLHKNISSIKKSEIVSIHLLMLPAFSNI